MRTIVVCLICTLLCYFSKAQYTYVPMPDSNAHWYNLSYLHLGGTSSLTHLYLKDSTITENNQTYNVLFAEVNGEEVPTNKMLRNDTLKRTFYRTVYENYAVEEELLNFGLNVGDTISRSILGTQNKYILDSITDIVIGGTDRRKFIFEPIGGGNQQVWIEGIGSLSGLTWPNNVTSFYYYNSLCRFVKNGTIEYNNSVGYSSSCNYLVDVPDIQSLPFKVYPNPSYNIITIEGEALQPYLEFSIYDIIGNVVYKSNITPNKSIDISHLQSGIYSVAVKDQEGKCGWQRMVKQ